MTLAAGTLIGFLATLASPQDDKALQSAIRKFQEDYYKLGAREDDKISAINYLAQHHHEKIVRVLSPLVSEGSLSVRMITARALSQFSGIDLAGKELLSSLQAQANSGKKMSAVRIEILRALGALRYKPAAADIVKLIPDREVWVAKAAIDAIGKIRVAEAVAPLIKALSRIESKEGDAEVTVNPLDDLIEGVSKGNLYRTDARQPKRPTERELLREPLQTALQSITKQSCGGAKDWDAWWSKNKATFSVTD
ncbi:MAG: hypothetical protein HY293_06985 [Planctomycetes bacterium]|nr:hypothetical protein [Planctomycetota bacterium]